MSSLPPGTRLGPYEIVSRIGAGGMGEVYRARDTRLDRSVAVKVLPPGIANNAEARARFEREARAISALNDPHICTLHDVGSQGDTAYLVMELLEGETLADVLEHGRLPLDRALRYAVEIATALDRAHRQNIVHRDLKPGNIMITRGGVKLLDFGLARQQAATSHDAPTISPITSEGMILGTLQYMSPEQLEGKPTDARTDLFSFGCILYEMVTGKRAFSGSSQASIISAIMTTEPPPVASLAPLTPPGLERLVRKCLEKSRDDRWQNAGDLATELQWIAEGPQGSAEAPSRKRSVLPWIVAAAAVVAAIATALLLARRPPTAQPLRLTFPVTGHQLDASLLDNELAVSRDGRFAVYTASKDGTSALWLRDLRGTAAAPIPNTVGGRSPFFSPDSRQIAFSRGNKLVRTTLTGDETATVCDVLPGTYVHGTWGHDGTIVFAYLGQHDQIFRVPAAGGTPQSIAPEPPTGRTFGWPTFIGDGDRIAYCSVKNGADVRLHMYSLSGKTHREIGPIESRVEIVDGYMFYIRDGSLFAQKVEPDLKRVGEPVLLASGVLNYISIGGAAFSASPALLAFAGADEESNATWFDRGGAMLGKTGPKGATGPARVSHDGRRLAVTVRNPATGTSDLWSIDIARNTSQKITDTPLSEGYPAWSPDDQRVAYHYELNGPPHLYVARASGGEQVQVTVPRGIQYMCDWMPDGRLLFSELNPGTRRDLFIVPAQPNATPSVWLQTPFYEGNARISPDGKWVAFVSDAPGRREVFIAPLSDPAARVQVSSEGGSQPAWRGDGKELFFVSDDALYAVSVQFEPHLETGTPRLLFRDPSGADWTGYDVTRDGQRIVITRTTAGIRTNPINVIVNWKSLLEKK